MEKKVEGLEIPENGWEFSGWFNVKRVDNNHKIVIRYRYDKEHMAKL